MLFRSPAPAGTSATPTAAGSAPIQPAPPADTTRSAAQLGPVVTDQVTRHLLAARTLRDGTRETVLHLAPEQLGPVTVTLQVRGGDVRLDLAAGDLALAALRADLGGLREGLSRSGMELTDVTLRPHD